MPGHNKVRAVVLNTNLYHTSNKVTIDEEDPAGQLAWLDKVLSESAANNEKVLTPTYTLSPYVAGSNARMSIIHWAAAVSRIWAKRQHAASKLASLELSSVSMCQILSFQYLSRSVIRSLYVMFVFWSARQQICSVHVW